MRTQPSLRGAVADLDRGRGRRTTRRLAHRLPSALRRGSRRRDALGAQGCGVRRRAADAMNVADLLTTALAREIADSGIDVFAVTSPATVVAAIAARNLGAPELAIAGGFTA